MKILLNLTSTELKETSRDGKDYVPRPLYLAGEVARL
jgi:hypothetical protein